MISVEKSGTPQELVHFGVKGMRWGVRKESIHPSIAHIPTKTRKEASKDAEEFTRAKLYYGQGAGTRRKLIKAKVESKKKKDDLYETAFDHFVGQTDLGRRAQQARRQRKRTDTTNYGKKTLKGIDHIIRGQNQYANVTALVLMGIGTVAIKTNAGGIADRGERLLQRLGIAEF